MDSITFFDLEVSPENEKLCDIGAVNDGNGDLHTNSRAKFVDFVGKSKYICGHNIFAFDLNYVADDLKQADIPHVFVDTLSMSPLLFPNRPYHHLLKDDKLRSDELNNPVNDAKKARNLFYDEVNAFHSLPDKLKRIFYGLLRNQDEYRGFFQYINYTDDSRTEDEIKEFFNGRICENADLMTIIASHPIELAYCLAVINTNDKQSIVPPWVTKKYPQTYSLINELCNSPCESGCKYCRNHLNIKNQLKSYFNFDDFRTYNGKPLQQEAVQAAVDGKSLLAVFQTGGGKSLTFQLPALIAGERARGLTVVISPLQSLMKDQVDNLEARGIADAVTINGMLSPAERKNALDRLANGLCSILYISPESLRSNTIEKLLISRNVVRFVIDEAHCFSAWGQDFRVDYLYIGPFIRKLQKKKNLDKPIAVSCFTATAKKKVIQDIRDYFRQELNLDLDLYTTSTARNNLKYEVLFKENDVEKYAEVRRLIQAKRCPTIVYVSRTRSAKELASRLSNDGYPALSFYGKMDRREKVENQDSFMKGNANGGVDIIVATSAFGMGVDKDNVGLVIHYDVSDSLENYIQEAGRAGRNPKINADCYILFNNDDLDKHFNLLTQTKLTLSDIQQVWKAVKNFSKGRAKFSKSALEIAKEAGWDTGFSNDKDNETKVKAAIAALENAGLIRRGNNVPHIYANGILVNSVIEADKQMDRSGCFTEEQKRTATRVIKHLISKRAVAKAGNDDSESRVDYIADREGIKLEDVVDAVNRMRQANILADSEDMTAYLGTGAKNEKLLKKLSNAATVENYLLGHFPDNGIFIFKEANNQMILEGIEVSTVQLIKSILVYWQKAQYVKKKGMVPGQGIILERQANSTTQQELFGNRMEMARFIVDYLYEKPCPEDKSKRVPFSICELTDEFNNLPKLIDDGFKATPKDINDTLFYLQSMGILDTDGFLISYNALQIERVNIANNYQKYSKENYRSLDEYYAQRIQQIHIVGKYANLLHDNYEQALQYIEDYFTMDYSLFIKKYFKGNQEGEIRWNITAEKYNKLFGDLSHKQKEIINDDKSPIIVVAAGPGSGKTKVLVHKLASLLLMENIRADQLLMLTFSRSAATEFKSRLIDLIGEPAYYVEIKTFHSYSFDILGRLGTIEDSDDVVEKATDFIMSGEADTTKITKSVLVIDEAQDMDEKEYKLIEALKDRNESLKIIAVGDDDQNIFEFRGSDSKYMRQLSEGPDAKVYELITNYRSKKSIVSISNAFIKTVNNRMKSSSIESSSKELGIVTLTKYETQFMDEPIVQRIKESYSKGSCCVLTATNIDALRITGVLNSNGIKARLIQSNDGFNLYNLKEIRDFIGFLEDKSTSPVVSRETWDKAIDMLRRKYKNSSCLNMCEKLISEFQNTTNALYISDFSEFVKESQYEDFTDCDVNAVLVSTIHKSKGREFDTVYMMLNQFNISSDENRRVVYVGITRAKNELHINYNNGAFDDLASVQGVRYYEDSTEYTEPGELRMQLSYKDVYLGFFKRKQNIISRLCGGIGLIVDDNCLKVQMRNGATDVLQFSKKIAAELEELQTRGFHIYKANVRFVVLWKSKDDEKEYLIILPDLYLKKENA